MDLKQVRIGFQGSKGSFAHEATIAYFGSDVKCVEYLDFEDAFLGILHGEANSIVVPIENSSTGSINKVYDLLGQYPFEIVGEIILKIQHNLMGIPGTEIEEIEEVFSHIQGFEQSSIFLKNHINLKLIPYYNTAYSAKYVNSLKDKKRAAIGSHQAAALYNLEILAHDIQDQVQNFTRFVIIGKEKKYDLNHDKISLAFSVKHAPGQLYKALSAFHQNEINLMKIESRPIVNKPWEYMFYIDLSGNINDVKIKLAIENLKKESTYLKVLGNYFQRAYCSGV